MRWLLFFCYGGKEMATTRLITIHISKGKGAGGSFAGRFETEKEKESDVATAELHSCQLTHRIEETPGLVRE